MDRALWLLMGLRVKGALRRLGRSVQTVRGALLVVVGVLVVATWLLPLFFQDTTTPPNLAAVRQIGPLALSAYCVLNVLMTSEGAITFSAAEVNFLFCGPLGRRQLLAYKVIGAAGSALATALFLTLFLHRHAASSLAAVVALLLTVLFLQLVPMALSLIASAVGVQAYNRRRKVVVAVLLVALAVLVLQAGGGSLGGDFEKLLEDLDRSPVVQTLLAPFRWFVLAFTAEQIWPDLVQWAALGLLVDMALIVLIFALDAHYLESSAAVSERLYARLQQLRQGGPAMVGGAPSGKARLAAPGLPSWGGVGPIAWRQLTTALRSLWAIFSVLLIFGLVLGPALMREGRTGDAGAGVAIAVGLLFGLGLFIPAMLPFDFRGDIDRMDLLKTLPLPAWRLVVGQLLTPVLLLTVIQVLTAVALQAISGRAEPVVLAGLPFMLPLNFLLFGMENLAFLWFPTRMTAANPGDLQALGRQVVLWLGKMLVLTVVLLLTFLPALAVYLLAGRSFVAGGVVAWLLLTGFALGLVPLVALAFRHYDVARDTPP